MNKKLLDVESSFLPEPSQITSRSSANSGADDTYQFGVPNDNIAVRKKPHPIKISHSYADSESHTGPDAVPTQSPRTPPGGYKTPAPGDQEFSNMSNSIGLTPEAPSTSALENMSSSPTAAAAARTLSRVQSLATMGGYETAQEQEDEPRTSTRLGKRRSDEDATPRKNSTQNDQDNYLGVPNPHDGSQEGGASTSRTTSRRPQYLHKRSSHARLSFDSIASSATEASDATLAADFALQTGGALPDSSAQRKARTTLSRQASLGSMMSGISGISDDEPRAQRHASATDLDTLEEESPKSNNAGGLTTPRASTFNFNMPTDTVIANNVRDLEVPGTFARQYRQERSMSPDKNNGIFGLTPGPKRGLTLKEHRSTVEKLGKENFDLKMKIHFLDQALQKRSEDGIKEMITENVQLKSDRLRLEKDNHNLRKQVRELQKILDETGNRESPNADQGYGTDEERSPTEAANAQNAEIERLRHEVSELQKMIGAQASTLTSRNKEKERLYQEIEDLKLGRMGGLRSVAGDSILDRSASRARSHSRASNGTRMSRLSDQERESLETRINELRDEVSHMKLENQNLQSQFDEALAELDAVDAQAQADADQFNEELQLLTRERDNALRDADEQDQAFQQLKTEAQEEIDGLGDELDAKVEECARFEQELNAQVENVKALQAEMRSAAEGLIRLEEDAQHNLAQYKSVKAELDDANRELENLEKALADAESKNQRLTVQQESSHNEIAFLREEQDADKIKIGDLESLLKKVHLNLESERDKSRDLERRINEERAQRDA
ncbi:hypothetical protein LTR40_009594, partial [Exophiala xenobiotica]